MTHSLVSQTESTPEGFSIPENSTDTVKSESTWRQAARVLLEAVGYLDDISSAHTLIELGKLLRGTGFNLELTPLIHNTIPAVDCMLGSLLELETGNWIGVLGSHDNAVILSKKGEDIKPFSLVDMQDVTHAWVLTERVIDMRSVMPFLLRYKSYFIDLFIAAIIVNVFALVLPLFSSFVYDKILGNGIMETMWALVIGLGIVVGIEFCVRVVRINIAERFSVGSEVEIDHATFRNLLDMKSNKIPSIGGLLEKYKQILSYRDFLSSSYILALADLPFLLLFLLAIMVVSGPLVYISIVCGLLMIISNFILTPPVLDYDRQTRVASEQRLGLMTGLLTSREAIIGSALRDRLTERWRQASVTAVQTASKSRYWRGMANTVNTSISYISFIGVLVGGVYMVEEHTLTSGALLAASMLTSRTMGTFASVITLMLRYREFRIALYELNQIVPSVPNTTSSKIHGRLQGAIRFDHVSCSLRQGDKPVLSNINLNINPGEIIGIAGAPGAGKTTLLRLIAGVLEPDEGRILIDNIPLSHLSPQDISLNMGFKPQESCLLDGTVEENVRAGRPQLTAEVRRDVLNTSGLFRVFDDGALHWATEIGARGSNLSGGQRQLVALARALLTHPPLILLDEPTNGLDAPLEGHLASQLMQMRGKSTILVSTHSRNILSICDRIIVVGQSKILADGPREKILM